MPNPFYLDCNLVGLSSAELPSAIQQIFQQLEDQSQTSNDAPITDAQHGDRGGGNLHAVATPSEAGFMSGADKSKSDHYQGDTSAAGPATISQYPSDGDWGFHTDTVGSTYKLAKNKGGTIFTVALT